MQILEYDDQRAATGERRQDPCVLPEELRLLELERLLADAAVSELTPDRQHRRGGGPNRLQMAEQLSRRHQRVDQLRARLGEDLRQVGQLAPQSLEGRQGECAGAPACLEVDAGQRTQRLAEGQVGVAQASLRIAFSGDDHQLAVRLLGALTERLHQGRLAAARLAADEDDAALAVEGRRQAGVEQGELALAADERDGSTGDARRRCPDGKGRQPRAHGRATGFGGGQVGCGRPARRRGGPPFPGGEIAGQVGGARIPFARHPGQATLDDIDQRRRRGRQRRQIGSLVEQRVDVGVVTRRLEGQSPGEHLEEHDAERPEVRSWVRLGAARLFGRHVPERADDPPDLRQALLAGGAGDAEVENPHLVPTAHQQVRGLDVAVDHALTVGRCQAGGDLTGDRRRAARLEGAVLQLPTERLAFAEGHDDEQLAVARLVDAVDLADVGVAQAGGELRLAQESSARLVVCAQARVEELERDRAPELAVLAAVDHPHAALAQLLEDAVATHLAPDQGLGARAARLRSGHETSRIVARLPRFRGSVRQISRPTGRRAKANSPSAT